MTWPRARLVEQFTGETAQALSEADAFIARSDGNVSEVARLRGENAVLRAELEVLGQIKANRDMWAHAYMRVHNKRIALLRRVGELRRELDAEEPTDLIAQRDQAWAERDTALRKVDALTAELAELRTDRQWEQT